MKAWFNKVKLVLIFLGIVYVLLALFVITAYTRVQYDAKINGEENPGIIIALIESADKISDVGGNFEISFKAEDSTYWENIKVFSIVYLVAVVFILYNTKGGGEYKNIEHGSGDWAKGEEYKVLNKKEGFVLGEKYYLPVAPNPPQGKNGNILVIRGFWFW